jgi:hypothetical protein
MAFLETGTFISLETYHDEIHHRVIERDVRKDDLYMMFMRLASHDRKREAAKKPIRMEEIRRDTGLAAIRFTILSDKLKDEVTTHETMQNGLVNQMDGATIIHPEDNTRRLPITQAFLKDYFDDQFGDMLDTAAMLEASGGGLA